MLKSITKMDYWLNVRPDLFSPLTYKILLVIFLLSVVVGIILSYRQTKKETDRLKKNILAKFSSWLYSFGIVGLIFIFLRQQQAPYLSLRLVFALWLLACLVWLAFIFKYVLVEIPKMKKAKIQKAEFQKYLPK